MSRIQSVLHLKGRSRPGPASSTLSVTAWMMALRAVPYEYSRVWQTPAELNVTQTGDCKGKAVALYAEMRSGGAQNLLMVIGKRHIFDSVTHTWLEWDTAAGRFVLDPTFNDSPMRADLLDPAVYVPFYAYDGAHKYRATAAATVASTTRTAMAAPASGTHMVVPRTTTQPTTRHRSSSRRGSSGRARRTTHVARTATVPTPPAASTSAQWDATGW